MTIPPDQTVTAAFLRGLAGAEPVETHISLVFLGSETVWKLKKAVRLPFLDFTRAADRRRFCERELVLNGAAAPGMYRDVVAVVRYPDGSLGLGDERAGTVVDWVLRMARVPAGDFLDVMAVEGRIDAPLLDAVADAVAAYHQALPPRVDIVPPMREIAAGNVRSALAAGLPADAVQAWDAAMRLALAAVDSWLEQRARDGFVRRTHGDLHLGNLCLWQGKPVPFDALEFDEALGMIDLGYDLAFLLMDLEHLVGRAAANRVLNRYVARTGDAALVRGLPVFLSMRAMVRAHVAARSGRNTMAQACLAMAGDYLQAAKPIVIAVGGLPGTGKSSLARALAPNLGRAPGALVVRSDEIRKRQHGVAPEVPLPQTAYTAAASRTVLETLAEAVRCAAGAGQAVVADATFMDPAHRAMVADAARQAGVAFVGLWLQAPLAVLEQRVASRTSDASDATVAVLHAAAAHDPGPGGWTPIDATDVHASETLVLTLARKALPPQM
jgi:aminoglycoside phosphotransferase family enzyme/predicted kinase